MYKQYLHDWIRNDYRYSSRPVDKKTQASRAWKPRGFDRFWFILLRAHMQCAIIVKKAFFGINENTLILFILFLFMI